MQTVRVLKCFDLRRFISRYDVVQKWGSNISTGEASWNSCQTEWTVLTAWLVRPMTQEKQQ